MAAASAYTLEERQHWYSLGLLYLTRPFSTGATAIMLIHALSRCSDPAFMMVGLAVSHHTRRPYTSLWGASRIPDPGNSVVSHNLPDEGGPSRVMSIDIMHKLWRFVQPKELVVKGGVARAVLTDHGAWKSFTHP